MAHILIKSDMSSRERVQRTFAHREPDRVPVDYAANAGINARLKAFFQLDTDDFEGLLTALGVDFRGIWPAYVGPRLHAAQPGVEVDPEFGMHRMWIEHASGGYFDYCDFPLADADDDTIARWPLPSPDDYDYTQVARHCARHPDRYLCIGGAGVGDIMNWTGMLRGTEATLFALAEEHEPTFQLIDRRLGLQLEMVRRSLEAGEGRIDMLWIGEDLGSQRGPLISLDMFRRLIRPRLQRLVDLADAHGAVVMIHSCGSSSWAFDDFVQMGIIAVDTLQPEAHDMQPAMLKEKFGRSLAFHGCLSTAGPVATGDVAEVEADVRSILAAMMPGGGYCAAPTHALQDNSPTRNVVAMYQAIHALGVYDSPAVSA